MFIINAILPNESKAQFIQGYGIAIGVTDCNETWQFKSPAETETKRFHLGTNAAIFFEMGDYYNIRWISEIMYNRKGAKEEFPYPDNTLTNNEVTYLSWNNYAKFRKELENTTPYLILGGRLEYKFSTIAGGFRDTMVNTPQFATIHACISGGGGIEFFTKASVIPFIEAQYFTDLPLPFCEAYVNTSPAYGNLHIRNLGFELRIGFKFLFHGSNTDKCPPVYVSPGAI